MRQPPANRKSPSDIGPAWRRWISQQVSGLNSSTIAASGTSSATLRRRSTAGTEVRAATSATRKPDTRKKVSMRKYRETTPISPMASGPRKAPVWTKTP